MSVDPAPPSEVLEQVDRAAERAEELAEDGAEVAFEHDWTGRLVIELRALDGDFIAALAPSQALSLLCD